MKGFDIPDNFDDFFNNDSYRMMLLSAINEMDENDKKAILKYMHSKLDANAWNTVVSTLKIMKGNNDFHVLDMALKTIEVKKEAFKELFALHKDLIDADLKDLLLKLHITPVWLKEMLSENKESDDNGR